MPCPSLVLPWTVGISMLYASSCLFDRYCTKAECRERRVTCVKGISIEEVPRVNGPLGLVDSLRGDEARRLPRRGYSKQRYAEYVRVWLLAVDFGQLKLVEKGK